MFGVFTTWYSQHLAYPMSFVGTQAPVTSNPRWRNKTDKKTGKSISFDQLYFTKNAQVAVRVQLLNEFQGFLLWCISSFRYIILSTPNDNEFPNERRQLLTRYAALGQVTNVWRWFLATDRHYVGFLRTTTSLNLVLGPRYKIKSPDKLSCGAIAENEIIHENPRNEIIHENPQNKIFHDNEI